MPNASTPPGPAILTRSEADSVRGAIEKARAETREFMKSGPTSYLATTQRIEYRGALIMHVGSEDSCAVRLKDP